MTIATTVPVLLVLGGPVTLALRALRPRTDGSMGPREWVLAAVHSPFAAFFGQPIVAGVMFVASLVVFYYSSLFDLALETHTGHVLMILHFLVAGYLFSACLVGIDPGLKQPTYPFRVLMVMVVFGFHALFSVSLMASSKVLAEDWFGALDRPWGRTLADDQYLGASLGWALGDYPLALLAGVLVYLWVRADKRESARFDRQEEREGDRQLAAYNARLRELADREQQ
jgi:putative copper resistance protein D